MNMDEYFVLFREYMLVQKPSSVNTRDSYPVSYTHLTLPTTPYV